MGVLACFLSPERPLGASCNLLRVPFMCWNALKIVLVFRPMVVFPVARVSNLHCGSPWHPEVTSSFEVFNSWDKKTGVKLEGRESVLTPSRPVPLICPVTQEL